MSLRAARAGLQEIASGCISPFDQRRELELANLTFLHRVWAPSDDQPVHFFLHRLALASPILKCVVDHRPLPLPSASVKLAQIWTKLCSASFKRGPLRVWRCIGLQRTGCLTLRTAKIAGRACLQSMPVPRRSCNKHALVWHQPRPERERGEEHPLAGNGRTDATSARCEATRARSARHCLYAGRDSHVRWFERSFEVAG